MVTIRPLQWPADRVPLVALDTSFVTDQVFHVVRTHRSVTLQPVPITPPLRKDYRFAQEVDTLPTFDQVLVAEVDATLVGIAAIKIEVWNQWALLWHFYIAPTFRGQGVGRRLMERILQAAHARNMRCVWLETQNINYGAIQFYERVGFQWCGLDTSLYHPDENATEEVALFFIHALTSHVP